MPIKYSRRESDKEKERIRDSCREMDEKYGFNIFTDDKGKTYYQGASTDWCCFPILMIPWAPKNAKKKQRKEKL